jgi:hypothetical protein
MMMLIAPSASATEVTPRAPKVGEYGVQFDFKKDGKKMTASLHPDTDLEKHQWTERSGLPAKAERQRRLWSDGGPLVVKLAQRQGAPVTILVDKRGEIITIPRAGAPGIPAQVKKAYYVTGLPGSGRYHTKRMTGGELARFKQNSPSPRPVLAPPRAAQYIKPAGK